MSAIQKAGNSLIGCGCLITLVPVIVILVLLLFA